MGAHGVAPAGGCARVGDWCERSICDARALDWQRSDSSGWADDRPVSLSVWRGLLDGSDRFARAGCCLHRREDEPRRKRRNALPFTCLEVPAWTLMWTPGGPSNYGYATIINQEGYTIYGDGWQNFR